MVLFYWVCAADSSDPLPHYSLYCGGGAWVYFTGYVPLVSQIPCPTIVYTVANCRRKAYLPPIPKNMPPDSCNSNKIQPHYSQFSRKNATLSIGTSLLAYFLEVPSSDDGNSLETSLACCAGITPFSHPM